VSQRRRLAPWSPTMSTDAALPRKRLFGAIGDLLCSGDDPLAAAAAAVDAATAAAEPPRQRPRQTTPVSSAESPPSPQPLLLPLQPPIPPVLVLPPPPPLSPSSATRRVTIADLLVAPPRCAACLDPVRGTARLYSCIACFGSFCNACLANYAAAALADAALLPLRCASTLCRAPIPLSSVAPLLPATDASALAEAQQRLSRPCQPSPASAGRTACGAPLSSSMVAAANHSDNANTRDHPETDADGQLEELMRLEGWKRCPQCGTGVERTQGCRHIVCVCGGEFCYQCGEVWASGVLGCSRQCHLRLSDAIGPGLEDPICFPGAVDMALNNARHQQDHHPPGNIPAHLFEHTRDQVWRRLLELLDDLRLQQLGNHPRRDDGRLCGILNMRDVDDDLPAAHADHTRNASSENVLDDEAASDHSVSQRLAHAVASSPLMHCPASEQAPSRAFSPRRVTVFDLIHAETPVSNLHGALHVQYTNTHRSMKLSSLVLHNLDYLLHDDEGTMD
jgi:hypothetical protein